jgi:hypothetical protein
VGEEKEGERKRKREREAGEVSQWFECLVAKQNISYPFAFSLLCLLCVDLPYSSLCALQLQLNVFLLSLGPCF